MRPLSHSRFICTLVLIVALLFGGLPINASGQGRTTPSDEWVDVTELNERLEKLTKHNDLIDRETMKLLDSVDKTMRADLEEKQEELLEKADRWTQNIDDVDVKELNASIDEALEIAERNGLNVPKLTKIYELTRKTIRRGEFATAADRQDSSPTQPMNLTADERKLVQSFPPMLSVVQGKKTLGLLREENRKAYFDSLIKMTMTTDEALKTADRQGYKVRLYKRAAVAFLKALLASEEPLPNCTAPARPIQTMTAKDEAITLIGCPDPVVDKLRDYLKAVQQIASADADVAAAEAEMLIAEQQYIADVIVGVPVVGDVVDLYSVYAGENIAGRELSTMERNFIGLMVVLPRAGVDIGQLLAQGTRRIPGFNAAASGVSEGLSFMFKAGKDTALGRNSQRAYEGVTDALKASWKVSVDELDEILVKFRVLDDKRTRFLNRAMAEAAHGRKLIDELPSSVRRHARGQSQKLLNETLEKMKLPPTASGMLPEHMDAYLAVASRHNEIYLLRPVNEQTGYWVKKGFKTKPMPVKPKSAEEGPFAALLPADSELSKIGTYLKDARNALKKASNPAKKARILDSIAALEKGLAKNQGVINKCVKDPACAKAVDFELTTTAFGSEVRLKVKQFEGTGGKTGFGVEYNGRWYDADKLKQDELVALGSVPVNPKTVKVLADPDTEIPYTADYDFLNYAQKRKNADPMYDDNTGFIPEPMNKRLDELEEATAAASEKARNVRTQRTSHHGPEQYFPGTPGVDYPITVIDGVRGKKMLIPRCDEKCMRQWCSATKRCNPSNICGDELITGCVKLDPDRLLKDYFHDVRLNGHSMDPNPNWKWGEYNALSGWTHPEVHKVYQWPKVPVNTRTGGLAARRILMGDETERNVQQQGYGQDD